MSIRINLEPIYRLFGTWLTKLIFRPAYAGFEKIPRSGPVVLISNHVSYIDGVIIAAGIGRPVRFVIDGNIYRLPGVHYFMKINRAIPILPKRDSVTQALNEVSEGLRAGDAVCIFPEGRLTQTGSLGRFRPGIEHIIKRDPVPVYPIALSGLWGSVFSRKYRKSAFRWWPRQWSDRIKATCGDPIPPERVTVNALQQEILKLKYSL